MNFIFDQISERFKLADSIIILIHENPDGDAVGSALAMAHYLKFFDKNVVIFCAQKPANYFFRLPGIEMIQSDMSVLNQYYNVALFLDCSDRGRPGVRDLNVGEIINIDHHISNTRYGKINFVDSKASSTSEIINRFLTSQEFKMDKRIADCLLAGIMTDTGVFINGATNIESMAAASKMIKRGTNLNIIFSDFFKNRSLSALKLWGEILSRLVVNKKYGIAYTYIKISDYQKFKVTEEEIDGITNFLNVIVDTKACFVFKIERDEIRVSSRSTREGVDLASLAKIFGGGGHTKAAGFSINYQLEELEGKLIVK